MEAQRLQQKDLDRFTRTLESIKAGDTELRTDRILIDIYSMMLHLVSKDLQHAGCVGLAIRKLPVADEGLTEVDNVREVLEEITGDMMEYEVLDAVRKGEREGRESIGTVLVTLRSEETRRKIMKKKNILKISKKKLWRNLIIKNMS